MKLAKRFAALLMGATMAIGSVAGLAACGESGNTDNNTQSAGDEQIRAIYDLYTANCAENNVTPQTYEQWLASIKGAKGDPGEDGLTPQIDPETGHWVIGDYDTGIKAAGTNGSNGSNGSNGVTPHIGANGNWFIGETDTGVPATGAVGAKGETGPKGDTGDDGQKGDPGENGKDGSSFLHGAGTPAQTETEGKEGDLYLDVSTWRVYEKTADGWHHLGSIKDPAGPMVIWNDVTVTSDGTQSLDCTGLEAGFYWLSAETETEAALGVLTASWTNQKTTGLFPNQAAVTDLYSPTSGFKGVVYVSGTESLTLSTSQASVTANFKLYNYEPVTVTANTECEIPVSTTSLEYIPLVFDPSMTGTAKVSFTEVPSSVAHLREYHMLTTGGPMQGQIFNRDTSFTVDSFELRTNAVNWYVIVATTSKEEASALKPFVYNCKIKIEVTA